MSAPSKVVKENNAPDMWGENRILNFGDDEGYSCVCLCLSVSFFLFS